MSKITVQAFLAGAVTVTSCAGFLLERIDGPTFISLAILAFGWAFRQPGAKEA